MSDDPTRTAAPAPAPHQSGPAPDPHATAAANPHPPPQTVLPDDVTAPWAREEVEGETRSGEPAGGPASDFSLPGYAIEGELGRGGMAVVYKARHLKLNRTVAIKTVLRSDPPGRARFLAEAEAVAAVKHRHVIQVFDFGESGGVPFLAMEYLPGGTLAGRLTRGRSLPPADAAALVEKLAAGVATAHDLGIVHRDLKPSNVLFDEEGEPKVVDFGLAKRTAGSDLTATQVVMGTPAYMAPEQARGAKFAGSPADVWALGVILYECLTGQRPFGGDGIESILSRVLHDDPDRPRELNTAVPHDLELICNKCLEKDPADRYPSASELADDLGRFVRGEPVGVRSAGRVERLAKWARRKPTLATAYALALAALVLGVITVEAVWLWRKAEAERKFADKARAEAEDAKSQLTAAKERLERVEYSRTIQLANRELANWDLARARPLLAGTREELRGWEWRYLHRVSHYELLTLRAGPTAEEAVAQMRARYDELRPMFEEERKKQKLPTALPPLDFVAPNAVVMFSPDGSRVVTMGTDRTVRVWDGGSGALNCTIEHPFSQNYFGLYTDREAGTFSAFSPNGTRVLTRTTTGFVPGPVTVVDAVSGAELFTLKGGGLIDLALFSPDGTWILIRERIVTPLAGALRPFESVYHVWDAADGKHLVTIRPDPPSDTRISYTLNQPVFSPDGSRILIPEPERLPGTWDAKSGKFEFTGIPPPASGAAASVWDVKSGKLVSTLAAQTWRGRDFLFSPDGRWVLSRDLTGPGHVWDSATGEVVLRFSGSTAVFTPDGSGLLTAWGDDQEWLRMTELRTQNELWTIRPAVGTAGAKFSPDGRRLVTWTSAGVAGTRLWDAQTSAQVASLPLTAGVGTVLFDPEGTRVLILGSDKSVRLWDTLNGAEVRLQSPTVRASGAAFSPNGYHLVTWGDGHAAHVWDTVTGRLVAPLLGHAGPVTSAGFRPDGKRVATASADGTVKVWNTRDERLPLPLRAPGEVLSAAFSPDGLRVVTAGNQPCRVWDVRTGAELFVSPPGVTVSLAVFGPDGGKVFAGALNGTVRVWDTATRAEVMALTGHTGMLLAIAFNAAGDRAVTASVDRTVRIWDLLTGQPLHVLRHAQGVTAAGFSPDGERVVTACDDKVVRVWDAGTGAELLVLPQTVPVSVAAFSPKDGNRLLIGGRDERVVRVLDVAAQVELLALRHPAGVTAAAFSPDGERIVTGGSDGLLRVWDATTGDEVLPIPTSSSGIKSVSLSPDGSRLLALRTGPIGRSPPVAWVRLFGNRVPVHREESAVLIWDGTPGKK